MLTPKGRRLAKLMRKLAKKFKVTENLLNFLNYYTEKEVKIILKYAKKYDSILDAGGGFGRLAIPLAKLGFSLTLLDVCESLIKRAYRIAKKENVSERIKFVEGDILNLKNYRNSFDVTICMRDVLNYTGEQFEKALSNVCSTVKRGGYLILSVGTKYSYVLSQKLSRKEMEKVLFKGLGNYEGIRVRVFDKEEIIKALQKRKFKIVEITGDSVISYLLDKKLKLSPVQKNFLEKIDNCLISKRPELAEHLIVVAKKS
jgi:ubiquinone/menaquinone biosynthesis C-methylase UbiE